MSSDFDLILSDLDEDLLMDFLDTVYYEQGRIEQIMMSLRPVAGEASDDVKQSFSYMISYINNIEAFCGQILMVPMEHYVAALSNLGRSINSGKLNFSAPVKELISLILDDVVAAAEDMVNLRCIDAERLVNNQQMIAVILSMPPHMIEEAVTGLIPDFIKQIDPSYSVEAEVVQTEIRQEKKATREKFEIDHDLETYEHFARLLDDRRPAWNGRYKALIGMALLINKQLKNPVDEKQLKAAILTHDLPMAFYSDEVLLKSGKLTAEEIMLIEEHPILAYELLKTSDKWDVASEIAHQHHERYDGQGYPSGLKGEEICLGARILPIVDVYYAYTHSGTNKLMSRTELRGLAEINRRAGSQFDPGLMGAFNTVVSTHYLIL